MNRCPVTAWIEAAAAGENLRRLDAQCSKTDGHRGACVFLFDDGNVHVVFTAESEPVLLAEAMKKPLRF